jgi:hypothetical protein
MEVKNCHDFDDRRIYDTKILNDLLVNCSCGKNKNYVENKRKEWNFLRMALKQKSVTPIRDRWNLTNSTVQRYANF